MQTQLLLAIRDHLDDPYASKHELLQRLWSEYGEIARYYSPKLGMSFIAKHVSPPNEVHHPRGWHSDVGHQRKVRSYQVEAEFYQSFAGSCDETCYVPQFIGLIKEPNHPEQQTLLMEDLQSSGFTLVHTRVTDAQVKRVLSWLAHFHGRFINIDISSLWSVGSYWYLATRQAEFAGMEDGALKHNASRIDHRLNHARFQTLLHGDAKLANFCFSEQEQVAAVDFQYVGRGVGVKDVMYFLGSCLTDRQLLEKHDTYVDYYFAALKTALLAHSSSEYSQDKVVELEQEWRELIPFAWADFNRFLLGWSPEHVKINDFMLSQTERALSL
ncbi:phosphotransferase [Paraglaciecola chathamensis]|uniref:phosphotransferase n=1 Tax=Paraglaciecola chathamensis TaxID=368405 RepID=UPI002706AF80|nr:phosphotransferase [Paraglaciecola chathamensis]MDO6558915.1 phosphotransferase [Paraglaciecola chathamensis]